MTARNMRQTITHRFLCKGCWEKRFLQYLPPVCLLYPIDIHPIYSHPMPPQCLSPSPKKDRAKSNQVQR